MMLRVGFLLVILALVEFKIIRPTCARRRRTQNSKTPFGKVIGSNFVELQLQCAGLAGRFLAEECSDTEARCIISRRWPPPVDPRLGGQLSLTLQGLQGPPTYLLRE